MDGLNREITRISVAKEERRQRLAQLPFAEKVQAVIQLQGMAAAILRSRGKFVKPWPVH